MKELVISFSFLGHTKKIGRMVSAQRNCGRKEFKSNILGVLWQLIIRGRNASAPDITDYATLWICSPVWIGKFAPSMRAMVGKMDLKGKTVHLIASYGSEVGDALTDMGSIIKSNGGKVGQKLTFKTDMSDIALVKAISEIKA